MAIPAQSGPKWTVTPLRGGSWQASISLTAATNVSDPLEIYDLPIDTIHVYGAFNAQNVSVLGFNANPYDTTEAAAATPQPIHRVDAPASTFSAVAAELLASTIESPRYVIAQANGAVTNVRVVVTAVDRKGK